MNIFITNEDPILAAQDLCDQHCRSKMIIESAIMLQNCFTDIQLQHSSCPRTKSGKPRKTGKGYAKHQCTVWVKEARENCKWLIEHAQEMLNERKYRWPSSEEHFTKQFILWCKENLNHTTHSNDSQTPFTVAINKESKCRSIPGFNDFTVVEQYRSYIINDKPFVTWTTRNKPQWY